MSIFELSARAEVASSSRFFADKAYRLFVLRSMLAPRVAFRWRQFIEALHANAGARPAPSRVLGKPLRKYVHASLSANSRLELMMGHHAIAREVFSRETVRVLCGGRIPFARLAGRKNTHFVVSLAASDTASMQREGELVLTIQREGRGEMLSRLSFSFATVAGESALIIGGLQGPRASARQEVVDATRELFGLRPKDATLLAARALARALGQRDVHAVADTNHVLKRNQGVSKWARYDEYWRERGAGPGGPFGFVFPVLADATSARGGRDLAKSAIVEGAADFVRAQLASSLARPTRLDRARAA